MTEYHTTANALADLVASKQIQYGDSATRAQAIAAILYPNGVSIGQYKDMLLVIRVIDKLSRIATSGDGTDAGGENPWQDIGGYALLGMARVRPATKTVIMETPPGIKAIDRDGQPVNSDEWACPACDGPKPVGNGICWPCFARIPSGSERDRLIQQGLSQ